MPERRSQGLVEQIVGTVVGGLILSGVSYLIAHFVFGVGSNSSPSNSSSPDASHPTTQTTPVVHTTPKRTPAIRHTANPSPIGAFTTGSGPSTPKPSRKSTPKAAVPAPTILDYTRLAVMLRGGSSANFCASVYVPASHQGVLFFSSDYGSFSQASFSVRGQVKRCVTYFAPDSDSVTSDHLTIRIIDQVSDKSAQASEVVPVKSPPPERP